MGDLVERLKKRAEEDQAIAVNTAAVFAALGEQYAAFNSRSGEWNTYAVRLAVDHKKSAERDAQYAADLREAAAEILRLRDENSSLDEKVKLHAADAKCAWAECGVLREEVERLRDNTIVGEYMHTPAELSEAVSKTRADAIEECARSVQRCADPANKPDFVMMGPGGILRQAVGAIRALKAKEGGE